MDKSTSGTQMKRRLSLISTAAQCWHNITGKEIDTPPMPKLGNSSSPRSSMCVSPADSADNVKEKQAPCSISQLDASLFEPIALVTPPKKRCMSETTFPTNSLISGNPSSFDFRPTDLQRMSSLQYANSGSMYNHLGQYSAGASHSSTEFMSHYAMATMPQHGFSLGTTTNVATTSSNKNSFEPISLRPPSAPAMPPVASRRRASLTNSHILDEFEPFLFGDNLLAQSRSSTNFSDDNSDSSRCPDLCASSSSLGTSTSSLLDDGNIIISTSDSFQENNYAKAEVEVMSASSKFKLKSLGTRMNKKRKHSNKIVTPSKSKVRAASSAASSSSSSPSEKDAQTRFKPFHEEKWNFHYCELLNFKKEHGHCLVPHTFPSKPHLARWVKRQRRQYKLRLEGNQNSTMTEERIKILNDVGFVWDSHEVIWNERFNQLVAYKEKVGHCRVPSYCKECPQLASWVKCQRRQYKLYFEDGKGSSMNEDRIRLLDSIGFIWEVHPGRKKKEENGAHYQHIASILMED